MKARYLGHVVFYVKDLNRSLAFYRDLLGFQEVGRAFGRSRRATSGRTHHELLLIEVGESARLHLPEDGGACTISGSRWENAPGRAPLRENRAGTRGRHQLRHERPYRQPKPLSRRPGRKRGRAIRGCRPRDLEKGSCSRPRPDQAAAFVIRFLS